MLSACGLPPLLVVAKDKILLFFTITHPTDGFVPVKYLLFSAKFIAKFIIFLSDDL